jgi:hypothetical protein
VPFGGQFGDCGHYHGGGVGNPLSDAVLNEFYFIAFRKKVYHLLNKLQTGRRMDVRVQRGARASGPLVLRQNADEDLSRRNSDDETQSDRDLTALAIEPQSLNQTPPGRSGIS